jgi:hypothetical protein
LNAVLGDADDLDAVIFAEKGHQRLGEEAVVVGKENADAAPVRRTDDIASAYALGGTPGSPALRQIPIQKSSD